MDFGTLTPEQRHTAQMVADHAREVGIDPELALALSFRESSFNPYAIGPKTKYGHAIGPMQVMESNAPGLGLQVHDLHDPKINIRAGMRILKENLARYNGNERAALVAYNAGLDPAKQYIDSSESMVGLPKETQNYLRRIHAFRHIGLSDDDFGGDANNPFGPPVHPSDRKHQELAPRKDLRFNDNGEAEVEDFGEVPRPPTIEAIETPPELARPNLQGMPKEYKKYRRFVAGESEDIPLGYGAAAGAGAGMLASAATAMGGVGNKELAKLEGAVRDAKLAATNTSKALDTTVKAVGQAGASKSAEVASLAQQLKAQQARAMRLEQAFQAAQRQVSETLPRAEALAQQASQASGNQKYLQAFADQDVPNTLRKSVEDMTRGNPRGKGAWDLLDQNAAAAAKQKALGMGDYQMTGKGSGELMLSAEDAAARQKMERELFEKSQRRAGRLESAKNMAGANVSSAEQAFRDAQRGATKAGESGAKSIMDAEIAARNAKNALGTAKEAAPGMFGKLGAITSKIPGSTILGGTAAGINAVEAMNRYEKGDTSGAVISGVSAVFDVMAMAPPGTPLTAVLRSIGIVGGAATLAIDLYRQHQMEAMKKPQAKPEARPTMAPRPEPKPRPQIMTREKSPLERFTESQPFRTEELPRGLKKDQYGRYYG